MDHNFLFFLSLAILVVIGRVFFNSRLTPITMIFLSLPLIVIFYGLDLPPFGSVDNLNKFIGVPADNNNDYLHNNSTTIQFNQTHLNNNAPSELLLSTTNDTVFNKSTVLDYGDILTDEYDLEDI